MQRFIVLITICLMAGTSLALADQMPAGPMKPVAAVARDGAGFVNDVGKVPELVRNVSSRKVGPLRKLMAIVFGSGAQLIARAGGMGENILSPYNNVDYGVAVRGKAKIAQRTVRFFAGK